MPGIWMDEGDNRALNILLGSQSPDLALYVGLYKLPTTQPAETAVLTDLTEPSGYGYARKVLARGSWTIVGSVATYAQQTFLAAGGDWGDCCGYFIATSLDNSGKLMSLEHFPAALEVLAGKGIQITPQITCD